MIEGEIRRGREINKALHTKFIWLSCVYCGKGRWVRLVKIKDSSFTNYCNKCQTIIKRRWQGDKHWNWKGGEQIAQYKLICLPVSSPYKAMANSKGCILEHRLVMAKHLSRLLERHEVVHHLNGDKFDNRIENLSLTDNNNHERHTLNKQLQARIRELEAIIDSELSAEGYDFNYDQDGRAK